MSNHPNRGKGPKPCHWPKPDEIRAAREKLGLTIEQAAELVCSSKRTWQNWEADAKSAEHRRMPAAVWRLFEYETGLKAPPALK
jgi:DNA-binding XRE family transcriptional regulator